MSMIKAWEDGVAREPLDVQDQSGKRYGVLNETPVEDARDA